MGKFFQRMGAKKFRLIAIACLIFGDLIAFGLTYQAFSDPAIMEHYAEVISGMRPENLPKEDRARLGKQMPELLEAMENVSAEDRVQLRQMLEAAHLIGLACLRGALMTIFLLHLLAHLFFYRGGKRARFYLKLYAIVAAPGCLLGSAFVAPLGMSAAALAYAFVAAGLLLRVE